MTVLDTFHAEKFGIILTPDFPKPQSGWKDRKERVLIKTQEGKEKETDAEFLQGYRRPIGGAASPDQIYHVTVVLKEMIKDDILIGSDLFASDQICELLLKTSKHNKSSYSTPGNEASLRE